MAVPAVDAGPRRSRTAQAVAQLVAVAEAAAAGERLGAKEELRARCGVSVGTFNEAIRVVQARGLITVRPGPGGGLFAAAQSPIVRLGNSVLALDGAQTAVAEAVRIRDALDPLMVEDALWHAAPADVEPMLLQVRRMHEAMTAADPVGFVRANWDLHACIAAVSPNAMLRSLYTNLLDLIESHTLTVLPGDQALPDYIEQRYRLHRDLVEAIAARDRDRAMQLIGQHATSAASHPAPIG
jgi:DNA-binding FadR family transcriptional regulator